MRRIAIELEGVVAVARLFDDKAPLTCQALWDVLPIHDRTIHVTWSGAAWRTENNYQLRPPDAPRENLVTSELHPGDVLFHANFAIPNLKIAFPYGTSQWLGPFGKIFPVDLIGKIEENLDPFVAVCEKILSEGPKDVVIRRVS